MKIFQRTLKMFVNLYKLYHYCKSALKECLVVQRILGQKMKIDYKRCPSSRA